VKHTTQQIEKIVLEVLEKRAINVHVHGLGWDQVDEEDFPNVAREVAERITNENR